MWFEDRSLSNMKLSSLIVEEWRDIWSTKGEFMVAALAYLFGFTNLLNMPRLVLENGGTAFLIAYLFCLLVVVLPILLLELAIGQLTGRAPVQTFYNICPVFKGVGISQILFSFFVMVTMTRFIGSVFLYIFHLFWTLTDDRPGLPWLQCKSFPEFHLGAACIDSSVILAAGSDSNNSSNNISTNLLPPHSQQNHRLATFEVDSAFEQFLGILDASSESIARLGKLQLHWLVAQCSVWLIVFCAICFGVRWLGKLMTFSLSISLILLLGLCGRALFLDGAFSTFEHLFVHSTDWERLKEWPLWKTAVEQALLACGLGFGAFCTLGSYNKKSNNLTKDSFLLVAGHILLGAIQLCLIVSLVGHISARSGLSPSELLVVQGVKQFRQILVYFAFIPHTKLFTGIFLFLTAFALLNILILLSFVVLSTLEDALGEKWSRCCPRFSLSLLVCFVSAASSVIFASQAGSHVYELTTGFLKYATLMTILFCELLVVTWLYCAHSLGLDLHAMIAPTCSWCVGHTLLLLNHLVTPIPMAIAFVNLMGYSYAKYSQQVRAWPWSEWTGVGIAIFPLLPIPLWALVAILRSCNKAPRVPLFRRLFLAFRSPLRHELLKSGSLASSTAHHRLMAASGAAAAHHHHQHTNYRNGGASSEGYTLLPQAPLAQPESDDVAGPGSARSRGTSQPQQNGHSTASTLRAVDRSTLSNGGTMLVEDYVHNQSPSV